jgi:hypothetical protein
MFLYVVSLIMWNHIWWCNIANFRNLVTFFSFQFHWSNDLFFLLTLARSQGFNTMDLNVDFKVIATSLNYRSTGSVIDYHLVNYIIKLLKMECEVWVCHSYREANVYVDAMTKTCIYHFCKIYEWISLSGSLLDGALVISSPFVKLSSFQYILWWLALCYHSLV